MNKFFLLRLYDGGNTVLEETQANTLREARDAFDAARPDLGLDERGYARESLGAAGHITFCIAQSPTSDWQ